MSTASIKTFLTNRPIGQNHWHPLISARSVPAYYMVARKRASTRRKPRAATEDVLGQPTPPERIKPKWRAQYKQLTELRERLLQRQAGMSQDAANQQPNFSSHMADAGTDTYDRDFALGMVSSEQEELYEIEQALKRIRDGNYGICELTGKPIEPARLEAIPWTRFTAEAEKELEKEGAVKRTRLGPRDTVARTEPTTEEDEG